MRSADTNVLVRLLAADDPQQTAAAETFVTQGVWVSTVALAETAWVLGRSYHLTPSRIADAIDMLMRSRSIVLQDADIVADALALFRERPALGFSDCLILELARRTGHLPLGTFDRKLARVKGAQQI